MAQGIREVEDVTSICQSLVLNMGTLEEERVDAMILAGRKALALGHPVILDPVGVTASTFRRTSALRLIEEVTPSLIRGNAAEICVLEQALKGMNTGNVCGVDSRTDAGREERIASAVSLAGRTGAVVVMTGTEDIVAGTGRPLAVNNGHPWMGRITGSGCMLDGILGAFCAVAGVERSCGVEDGMAETGLLEEAAAAALCAHGICGELAGKKAMDAGGGTGSFRMYLMDYMSILNDEMLERGKRIEIS